MHFCTVCEITFVAGGPGKSIVVLEKSLKMVAMFCMNPVFGRFLSHHYTTNVVEVDWNCNAIFASSLW